MALLVITLQDEPDGTVSFGVTLEPVPASEEAELTGAQITGMVAIQAIMETLSGEEEDEPSRLEG